jgi:putative zinc finger protein
VNWMNCKVWESLIALYIEGDLSASDLSRVVSHLDGCEACRYFADELRESQSMFKSLRAGTVNSADLVGVRQRVLNEVGDLDPAPGWVLAMHRMLFAGLRRRNAIAGAAFLLVVSGSVWYSQMPRVGENNPVHESRQNDTIDVARIETPEPTVLPNATQPLIVPAPRIVKPEEPPKESDVLPTDDQSMHLSDHVDSSDPETSQIIPFKFVTDDPDIIIYWLPTDKGD